MYAMNPDRELMRSAGPLAVLKLLERREMYGYQIVEALAERSGGLLAMGQSTLYPMLYNLESKGLVTSRWDESTPRGRKYYALTPAGRRKLAEDVQRWRQAADAMRALGVLTRLAPCASLRALAGVNP
jgi:PadR family transcriptional regulator PadR